MYRTLDSVIYISYLSYNMSTFLTTIYVEYIICNFNHFIVINRTTGIHISQTAPQTFLSSLRTRQGMRVRIFWSINKNV